MVTIVNYACYDNHCGTESSMAIRNAILNINASELAIYVWLMPDANANENVTHMINRIGGRKDLPQQKEALVFLDEVGGHPPKLR